MIDTSFMSFWVSRYLLTTAWPASWYAVNFLSFSDTILLCFSKPTVTFLTASSISLFFIASCFLFVAIIAASFNIFSSSAPVKPAVSPAIDFKFTFSANFLFLLWIFSISSLPLKSGSAIVIVLSNLPGRSSASSNISGLFVAAITIIDWSELNPSISTKSWFNVWLFSVSAPLELVLLEPIASISSIKIIQGDTFFAFSNNFLTLEAPSPANISTNSEPLIEINGTFASPAIAFAINVFPVPGFPQSSTPLGVFAPIFVYCSGLFKNSTISIISAFSSSRPATSLNVILSWEISGSYTLPLSPRPCICIINITNIIKIIVGKRPIIASDIDANTFLGFCINSISFSVLSSWVFSCTNSTKACVLGTIAVFSSSSPLYFNLTDVLPTVISTFSIFPSLMSCINCVYATFFSSFCWLLFINIPTTNTAITINIGIIVNKIFFHFSSFWLSFFLSLLAIYFFLSIFPLY